MSCMSLIVAMEMKEHEIAQDIVPVVVVDVINLQNIPISKVQFTPAAFPLLLLKEFSFPCMHEGMRLQALTPIEQVSIVRTGCSSYLFVPLNRCFSVKSKFCTLWGAEGVFAIYVFPVFGIDPASGLP